MLVNNERFAIVDIETTGGSYRYDKITEIAIIVYQNGEIIDRYQTLVNPCRSIPPEITRITGITNEMVEEAPKFYEIAKEVVEKTESCIFVAHNVFFDYSFIKEEFNQLGFTYTRKKLCTVQLSRRYIKGLKSYSLDSLIRHLKIDVEKRHRAMDDTLATLQVFKLILKISQLASEENKSIHYLLKENKIPAHLDATKIRSIPEACGVYYMKNIQGFNIYIGKSLNINFRIMQHFNEVSSKNNKMLLQVHDIDYMITGNELMALLIESRDIKLFQPEINKAQRNKSQSHAIVKTQTDGGFYVYVVKSLEWLNETDEIVNYCGSAFAAKEYLKYLYDEYNICSSINKADRNDIKPCNYFQLGKCFGACAGKENIVDYNLRFDEMHNKENKIFDKDFIIIDYGRNANENSLIVIENGFCRYTGYLEQDMAFQNPDLIKENLDAYKGNIETNRIIANYMNKNNKLKIIYI